MESINNYKLAYACCDDKLYSKVE